MKLKLKRGSRPRDWRDWQVKHVSGSGRIACTSADGGAHKSCTVNFGLRGI